MKIGETKNNVIYTIKIKEVQLKTNDSYESILTKLENAPKIINNLQGFKATVEQISDEVNSLTFEHRIKKLLTRNIL